MSGPGSPEHWFDRLAVRHTRRQALKAALAGTALTLPLLRAAPADAAGLSPCAKGCWYTNHYNTNYALNTTCVNVASGAAPVHILAGLALGFGFYSLPASLLSALLDQNTCQNLALLNQKATGYDCLQPNCPGFDPNSSGGPCTGCHPPGVCCTDQGSITGYNCCECCAKTGGCASGVTDCGA